VQHANELLVRLNQWKKWCQVYSIRISRMINIIFMFLRLNDGKCRYHNEHG
jgi:hypothetical protein